MTDSAALPDLPRLPDDPHLADVVPSILAAMGVPDTERRIEVPDHVTGACILLIDGLGAEQLDEFADDAPVLTALRRGRLQVGYPSTTAAGIAAVGTGRRSGEHGMVGYTFRPAEDVRVLNALRWCRHPDGEDLRTELPPERLQPLPTTFERAAAAGIDVSVINYARFAGSGLSRSVLRGARYVGIHAAGDLIAAVRQTLIDGGFCYGYHSDLDTIGHLYGPGSQPWRMQLRQVDRLVESVVEDLPSGALVAVVSDHGMVRTDPERTIDMDGDPRLTAGLDAVAGEARARHLYTTAGALADVVAAWREVLGDLAYVVERDEAIAAGWFGDIVRDAVRPRIGDVVVAARGRSAVMRRTAEPHESALPGHHGSFTSAELYVPLVLAGV